MAWPLITLTIKLLTAKFLKGAVIGLWRYFHRLCSSTPMHDDDRPKVGWDKVHHVIRHEVTARQNVIYLLLMLGNVFFGLQELVLWIWVWFARRRYMEFRSGMPAALENPETICNQLAERPWREVMSGLTRWLMIASLVYWPRQQPDGLNLRATQHCAWIEIRVGRHVYAVRIDHVRRVVLHGITIDVAANGVVNVETNINGQLHTARFTAETIV